MRAVSFTGTAELTFADNEHLLVEADRVLVAMSDRGVARSASPTVADRTSSISSPRWKRGRSLSRTTAG